MPAEGRRAGSSARTRGKSNPPLYSSAGAGKAQRPPWGQGGRPLRVPATAVTTRPGGQSQAHAVWEQLARSEAEKAVQSGWISDAVRRAVAEHSKTQPRARGSAGPANRGASAVGAQRRAQGAPHRPASAPAHARKPRKTPGIDFSSDTASSSSSSSEEGRRGKGAMSDDSDDESVRSRGRGGEAGARTATARPNQRVTIVTRVEGKDPDARVRALTLESTRLQEELRREQKHRRNANGALEAALTRNAALESRIKELEFSNSKFKGELSSVADASAEAAQRQRAQVRQLQRSLEAVEEQVRKRAASMHGQLRALFAGVQRLQAELAAAPAPGAAGHGADASSQRHAGAGGAAGGAAGAPGYPPKVHRLLLGLLSGLTALAQSVGVVSSGPDGAASGAPLILSSAAGAASLDAAADAERRAAVSEAVQEKLAGELEALREDLRRERERRDRDVSEERERGRLAAEAARAAAERAAADLESDESLVGQYKVAVLRARTHAASLQERLSAAEMERQNLRHQVGTLQRAVRDREAECDALRASRDVAVREARARRDAQERAEEAVSAAGFSFGEAEGDVRRRLAEAAAESRRADDRARAAEAAAARAKGEASAAKAAAAAAEERCAAQAAELSVLRATLNAQEGDIQRALAVVAGSPLRGGGGGGGGGGGYGSDDSAELLRRAGGAAAAATAVTAADEMAFDRLLLGGSGGRAAGGQFPDFAPLGAGAGGGDETVWGAIARVEILRRELAALDGGGAGAAAAAPRAAP